MKDILLVSTADWDNPYWTNKQHVAVQLAAMGYRILYVESQGLRRPTISGRDFSRIINRIKKGLRKPKEVRPNLWVWSPIVIPLQSFALVRKLNKCLVQFGYKFWGKVIGLNFDLMWTYSPLTIDFYDIDSFDKVIYHAVDDIKAQPGMPRDIIEKSEILLVELADIVFTTAQNLQKNHKKININTHYFPNVADYDHFNKAMDCSMACPEDMRIFEGPVVGFVGAVSSYKLDFKLILGVANAMPDCNFVFVGEVGEGDPWTSINIFSSAKNVHFLGGRDYNELPAYLKSFNVAILPSLLNEYTRSMFPMKFFEYLAAGRPIVSVRLPALVGYEDVATFCDGIDDFVDGIRSAINGNCASLEKRLAAAKEQTYKIRTQKMMALVDS